MKASETQIGGDHYKKLKKQPFDLIKEISANFWVGNIIKYVTRFKDKNGEEDLRKALHYLQWISENHPYQPVVIGSAQKIGAYCRANNMSSLQRRIIWYAYSGQLYMADTLLMELIHQEYSPNNIEQ